MKNALFATCLLAATTAIAADDDRGATLYQVYCTQCHGLKGDGRGINAAHMSVLPRDHTDTGEMSARTDEELFKVIKHGGKSINKSVQMPIWGGNLSDEDIHALVGHLRKLCCDKN
jgi:cytochrome c oxidase cbb3-type subunit 3